MLDMIGLVKVSGQSAYTTEKPGDWLSESLAARETAGRM